MDNSRRIAGWSAVAAAVLYLLQPVIVALGGLASTEDQDFLLPSQVRAIWWSGAVQAVVLIGIGLALLVLVTAVGGLVRHRLGPPSALLQSAQTLGIVGGVGWLFGATTGMAGYSTVAAFMAETGADEPAQRAALHMVNVMVEAGLGLSAIGLSVWLATFSVTGRRAGIIGRVLSAAGLLVAVLSSGTALAGFPFGLLLLIPYLPFLGVKLLRARPVAVPAGSATA